MEVVERLPDNETCVFCHHNEVDELRYGKMYKIEDIYTHYFCMLFSANMEQNGADEDGILGFLPNDIRKEVARGRKLVCCYCRHAGATIGCFLKACKKKFHYPCGIQHGSLHLFYGQFRSYCSAHRRSQTVPQHAIKLTEKSICVMCQDEVVAKPMLTTLWAPCCKTAWLHRTCVQRMAVNAGYFFKCPNCNNKDTFRNEMLECGVYIPDQDAAWELEPNAFNELTERHSSCDVKNCVCPKGRDFNEQGSDWEILLCSFCGSQGTHNKCGEYLLDDKGQWTCTLCSSTKKSDSSPSNTLELAGPSELLRKQPQSHLCSQNLRKEMFDRSQKYQRRKRNLSPSSAHESECTPSKVPPEHHGEDDTLCLYGNSGEQIKVVRLENNEAPAVEIGGVQVDVSVVQIDSDDDDDNKKNENSVHTSQSSNDNIEKKLTELGLANRRRKSNPKRNMHHDTVPSIIIDLVEDSDDEMEVAEKCTEDEPAKNDDIVKDLESGDEDDDDVIFVGCDIPVASSSRNDTSTALIRIVDHDRVLIATPTEIRKNCSYGENIPSKSTNVTTSTLNSTQASFRVISREHTSTDTNRSYVWQSVPLHKSNNNTYPPIQITSIRSLVSSDQQPTANNVILEKSSSNLINEMQIPNIRKENQKGSNESNSWIADSSEIINLD